MPRGRVGVGEQVRRYDVGHAEAGDGDEHRGIQQVGVAGGPGGQGEGEEECGAGDAGEGAQVRPRGGGKGPEGLGRLVGGGQGEQCWDGQGRQSIGQALDG